MESTTFSGLGTVLCRDGRRYRILAHLADGRHGPICSVRNAYGKQCVAKCFRATRSNANAFRREASALEALRHPNVVYLFDTVADESGQWLILEACNMNLGGWLKQAGRGAARHFPAIASGMLQALDYVHRCGFLHGDIRPRNILLTIPGKARPTVSPAIKLTDFGDSIAPSTDGESKGRVFSGGGFIRRKLWTLGALGVPTSARICSFVRLCCFRCCVAAWST